jgi:hypothetical protein
VELRLFFPDASRDSTQHDAQHAGRPLADLVIYELMIDDFTASYRGTRDPVDAVGDRLDYLVDLGVSHRAGVAGQRPVYGSRKFEALRATRPR